MLRTPLSLTARRRSRLSVFVILSSAAIGCADVSDDAGHAELASTDAAYEVEQVDQTLLANKIVVSPVKGSSTTFTVRAVEDEKPKATPTVVSSGPTIVGVTRTATVGGKKLDTKKEDAKEDTKKEDTKKEGGVTVRESAGKTIISVPGFPDITLTPDKNSKDGGIIVSVPGMPDFAAPAGTEIEAPGGIKIVT